MTTYNTYQEAKIANPESDIYVLSRKTALMVGKFQAIDDAPTSHFSNSWALCNPADYCMTINDFLDKGHKFVEGDIYMFGNGLVNTVKTLENTPVGGSSRYILCAAALNTNEEVDMINQMADEPIDEVQEIASAEGEASKQAMTETLDNEIAELQKKSRTKVEYVKVEFNHVWEVIKEQEEKGNIFCCRDHLKESIDRYDMHIIGGYLKTGHLHRKVESPIAWHEDAIEFAQQCKGVNTAVYIPEYDAIDIDGSMTREEACDYARILLEQGGSSCEKKIQVQL